MMSIFYNAYNKFLYLWVINWGLINFHAMAKLNEADNTTTINLISLGTDIIGDIRSSGDIRIDGTLKGNLITKGKVVIGPTGKINGEVECKNSEISGIIEGKITVNQLLNLKASSKIIGDIITAKLSIEPGALFTGHCSMKDGESPNAGIPEKPKEAEKH
jgi:cytoskeletal protein CcmA (bactofilin family)